MEQSTVKPNQSAPTPKIRSTSAGARETGLPAHVRLSKDETAMVSRLIRSTRDQKSWLGPFLQWLLRREAESAEYLTVADVKQMLDLIESLEKWANFSERSLAIVPELYGHRAFAWVTSKANDTRSASDGDDSEEFMELVRLWRLDHPEPEKERALPPAGYLARTEGE